MNIHYGNGVIVLPREVLAQIGKAKKQDITVLLHLLTGAACAADFEACGPDLAHAVGITMQQLEASLSFWRGTGLISCEEEESEAPAHEQKSPEPAQQKLRSADGLPEYSSEDISRIFKKTPDAKSFIETCEQILGRIFNTAETGIILGLREYLGLDEEYILVLFAHCAKKNKRALKYIERMAFSLYEKEIDTPLSLEEHFKWLEAQESQETKLRTLFGMKSRVITKKERDFFTRWFGEWGMSFDLIRHAYDVTVDGIGEPSMPYMNKILENWNASGIKTVKQAKEAGQRDKNKNKKDAADSFDTDEFFALAVKRGLSN